MAKGKAKQEKKEIAKTNKAQKNESRKLKRSRNPGLYEDGFGDLNAQLRTLQLCTKDIAGDGNCLFRALSDQYYGSDRKHKEIRQEVCRYMCDHEDDFKYFVEDDRSFKDHVRCMESNGTYGGNMELVAFARLFNVNIKVYQPGLIYIIPGTDGVDEYDTDNGMLTLHIAYHSWEHYSSIRNILGPHTGPPEIEIVSDVYSNVKNEDEEDEESNGAHNSKEKVVQDACPDATTRQIRRLLRKFKGDPDKVIDHLYDMPKDDFSEEMPKDLAQSSNKVDEILIPQLKSRSSLEEKEIEEIDLCDEEGKSDLNVTLPKDLVVKENKIENLDESNISTEIISKPVDSTKSRVLSARERKQLAKREQKEKRLAKKRESAAKVLEKHKGNTQAPKEDGLENSMKQLFI